MTFQILLATDHVLGRLLPRGQRRSCRLLATRGRTSGVCRHHRCRHGARRHRQWQPHADIQSNVYGTTYSPAVSPVPLRSGLSNTLSLDFGPGGDDGGLNDDNFTTAAKPVSGTLFNEITVELAFRMDSVVWLIGR